MYGNAPECRVDATCERPHNAYAFSKWLFDKFVADRLRAGGLRAPVLGFRLFNVFGPGEDHKGANAPAEALHGLLAGSREDRPVRGRPRP